MQILNNIKKLNQYKIFKKLNTNNQTLKHQMQININNIKNQIKLKKKKLT